MISSPSNSNKPDRRRPHPPGRAFTLIELLTVVAIMGIIMLVAIPAFRGIGRSTNMQASLTTLRTRLNLARQWAITQRADTYVLFPSTNTTFNHNLKAELALRSYAVAFTNRATSKIEYLTEWQMLPAGVMFVSDVSLHPKLPQEPSRNVFTYNSALALPEWGATARQIPQIRYRANGRVSLTGHYRVELPLMEGAVTVTTNVSGAIASSSVVRTSTNVVWSLDIHALTGNTRIKSY